MWQGNKEKTTKALKEPLLQEGGEESFVSVGFTVTLSQDFKINRVEIKFGLR